MNADAPGTARTHTTIAPLLPFYEMGTLSAAQRQELEEHVLECDLCFESLESAAPAMAALRVDPVRAQRALRAHATPGEEPITSAAARDPRPRAGWLTWLAGGLTGAAVTAAVGLLMLRPSIVTPPQAEPSASSHVVPWVAPSNVRGASASVSLPAGANSLVLMLAVPTELDTAQPASVEVTRPDGVMLPSIAVAPSELARSTLLVTLESSAPFLSGVYRVVVRGSGIDATTAEARATSFRVQLEDTPPRQ